MAEVTGFAGRCLKRQGFVDLDDAQLARLNVPLRFTPVLCGTAVVTGMALQSAVVLGILAISAAVAAAGVAHPFDVLYNRTVRHVIGGPELPRNPAPRRFAFVMAAPVLTAAAVAYGAGAPRLGLLVGSMALAGCLVYVLTGWCMASYLHEKLFGPVETTARAGQAVTGRG